MKFITLAFAGLAAVAMAAVGDVNTKPADIGYNNDAQFTYHCDRDIYVVRCAVEGACSTIEECVLRCIDGEAGAYCKPVAAAGREVLTASDGSKKHRSTSDTQQVDEATTALKARYPIPQENRHHECSKDGASVLLCRWGFCATEYYCKDKKKDSWCHTDCTCCKKGKMGAAEVGDEATGAEDTEEEIHHVRNDATSEKRETDNTIGCQIGTTKCSPSKNLILSCFDGQKYSPFKACGRGCCNDDSIPGRAFCSCGQSIHGLDSPVPRNALVARIDSPLIPQEPAACRPGSKGCNGRYILFCNGLGTWYVLQDCGLQRSCVETLDGDAWCFGHKTTPAGQLEQRELRGSSSPAPEIKKPRLEQPAKRASIDSSPRISDVSVPSFQYAPEDPAQPAGGIYCPISGTYSCIGNDIYVCNGVNSWQLSAQCGETARCKDYEGIAFCVPR